MLQSLSRLLLVALLGTGAGLVMAADAQAAPAAASLNTSSAPRAFDAQTQTVTYDFSYDQLYAPGTQGGSLLWVGKQLFEMNAPEHTAFTGRMSATLTASYDLGGATEGNAGISLVFDVLVPRCAQCSMFDSDLVGAGHFGSLDDDGSHLTYTTDTSIASGQYGRLLIYEIITGELTDYSGYIHFQSITFTAETVAVNWEPGVVPELPPVTLFALGLALLGAVARTRAPAQPDSRRGLAQRAGDGHDGANSLPLA